MKKILVTLLFAALLAVGLQVTSAQAAGSGYVYSSTSSQACAKTLRENGTYGTVCPGQMVYSIGKTYIGSGYKATWSKNGTIQPVAYGPVWISTHTYNGNSYRITVLRR